MSDQSSSPSPAAASGPSIDKGKVLNPATLRFQRRTSERAFYEGALREPAMDYGAGSGTSPWASSPEASRTSFGDVPRQELPGPAMTGNEEGQLQHHEQSSGAAGWVEGQQQQWQHQHQPNQQHQPYDPQHGGSGEENRRPQSARYHNVQPHQQQPKHLPQHKLQAKITGLERTGKKDPILRFDVYVCEVKTMLSVSAWC